MYDLIIIGAGLAGLGAAYAAVEAGMRVKILARGLGALYWGAGTVDVLGYVPGRREVAVDRPDGALAALFAARPGHPYARVGAGALFATLDEFAGLLARLGVPYAGAALRGTNLLLPSPAGAGRPTWLAPAAQCAGDLARHEPFLIVGFRGLRDFYPELIAANLRQQGQAARAVFLPLDVLTDRHDANEVHLAGWLDAPAAHRRLGAALAPLVRPGERIGLPAILGLHEHPAVVAEVARLAGATVCEIPTLPPSVPGMRLFTALRRYLEGKDAAVNINMAVTGWHSADGRVAWVETESSARPRKHAAGRFLLATGGILGGGINSDHSGRIWEDVFGLPLAMPATRGEWFGPRFLNPGGHPVFRGGVPVDAQFRPIDEGGAPVYANVWAAGGLLAHADPIEERSLEGIAIATGIAAVQGMTR